jgi:hypothetical protein
MKDTPTDPAELIYTHAWESVKRCSRSQSWSPEACMIAHAYLRLLVYGEPPMQIKVILYGLTGSQRKWIEERFAYCCWSIKGGDLDVHTVPKERRNAVREYYKAAQRRSPSRQRFA